MNCNFISTKSFEEDVEVATAQYPALKDALSELKKQLEANPYMGEQVGDGIYTVPVMVQEANNGKEKPLYALTYVFELNFSFGGKVKEQSVWVILLHIYDSAGMSERAFKKFVKKIKHELRQKLG